jgi:hypothetical protein
VGTAMARSNTPFGSSQPQQNKDLQCLTALSFHDAVQAFK